MANAAKLSSTTASRLLVLGYPGAGKTGTLCSLIDAGLKLRILAYDMAANMQPLFTFTKDKSKLENVDIVYLEDKLRSGPKFMEPVGIPSAFADGVKLMDRWKYKEGEGEVDLGQSKEWGPDTVVVLDSLTAMGEAAKRRSMAMLNKTPLNMTQQCWGLAMQDQWNFLQRLVSSSNRFHVVVLAHLKLVGPKDVAPSDNEDSAKVKRQLIELVPTRLYPSALGQGLPPQVASLFSTVLLAEPVYGPGTKVSRVLRTVPRAELDLKLPAQLPDKLSIEDGLLQVFEATSGGPSVWFNKEKEEVSG